MNKSRAQLIFILLFFTGGLIYWGIDRSQVGYTVPDPVAAQEIQNTIHQAYSAFRTALRNGGDVSKFENVFTNTSDYAYESKEVRSFVEQVMGPKAAQTGGYLTAMQAKYIAYGCAVRLLKDIEPIAGKENRKVSQEEIIRIKNNCYGVIPPSISEGPGQGTEIKFERIVVRGNLAIVRYDDGAALSEAILVRQAGHWRIANIKALDVHF
jgi:hypothetical protein